MSENAQSNNLSLAPDEDLGASAGLIGSKNPDAKELSRKEFLKMAEKLNFNERELKALSVLYQDDIETSEFLDNSAPSLRY